MTDSNCTRNGCDAQIRYRAPDHESYRGRGDWADVAADMLIAGEGGVVSDDPYPKITEAIRRTELFKRAMIAECGEESYAEGERMAKERGVTEWHIEPTADQCPECRTPPGCEHNEECPDPTGADVWPLARDGECGDCGEGRYMSEDKPVDSHMLSDAMADTQADMQDAITRIVADAFAPTHGRYFASGAYRDSDEGKNDYAGYLSPIVIKAFGDYMTKHRVQSDGEVRASDNWKKGITLDAYFRSMFRHFVDVWMEFEGYPSRDGLDEALGGLFFNVCGYWMEYLREKDTTP